MVRKALRSVRFDDIISTAFTDDRSLLNPTLRGHLVIEALLVELIGLVKSQDDVWKWTFPQKTRFAIDQGIIEPYLKKALDRFNEFRNDFAHIFGYQPDSARVHELARQLEEDGVDFSDSVGAQPLPEALHNYDGESGILQEVLWCLAYEVAYRLAERGGRDLFSA